MKKQRSRRLVLLIHVVLAVTALLSACTPKDNRLPTTYTYSPGAAFTTNVKDEDPRRLVKCTVVFEVIDEAAATEMDSYNFAIRNAVLIVLTGLTLEELTTQRDLVDISQKIVSQVNSTLRSNADLVIGAYFTEFTVS